MVTCAPFRNSARAGDGTRRASVRGRKCKCNNTGSEFFSSSPLEQKWSRSQRVLPRVRTDLQAIRHSGSLATTFGPELSRRSEQSIRIQSDDRSLSGPTGAETFSFFTSRSTDSGDRSERVSPSSTPRLADGKGLRPPLMVVETMTGSTSWLPSLLVQDVHRTLTRFSGMHRP